MAKKSGTPTTPPDDVGNGPGASRRRGSAKAAEAAAAEAVAPGGKPARGAKAPGTGVAVAGKPAATKPAAKSAAKAPAKSAGGRKRETFDETAARRRQKKEVDQLEADLRAFAIARPGGWNHEDWLGFLDSLRQRGHQVSDAEEIGARLERERLSVVLGGIQGIGPKKVDALVTRFHTLYSVRHSSVEELVAAGLNRADAERVARELEERYP